MAIVRGEGCMDISINPVPKQSIARIKTYTHQHPELMRAHHFTFDLKLGEPVEFCVMGINPGEPKESWPNGTPSDWFPLEESSASNFQTAKRSKASTAWLNKVRWYAGTNGVLLSEYFFWSSANAHSHFRERFGTAFDQSPHLKFCRDLNLALFQHYKPRAVISPGLGVRECISAHYGLSLVEEVRGPKGHLLIAHFSDGDRPWLSMKHWTGARPNKEEQQRMRAYVAELSGRSFAATN